MKIVTHLQKLWKRIISRFPFIFEKVDQDAITGFTDVTALKAFGRRTISTGPQSHAVSDDASSLYYKRAMTALELRQSSRKLFAFLNSSVAKKKKKKKNLSKKKVVQKNNNTLTQSGGVNEKVEYVSKRITHARKQAKTKAQSLTKKVGGSLAMPLTELPFLARKKEVARMGGSDLEKDSRFRTVFIVCIFAVLIYIILIIKVENMQSFNGEGWFFLIYSFAVTFYVLSRLLIAYFYKPQIPEHALQSDKELPTVTFGIPCKDEAENICETIERIAASDYPKEKFDIIVINDGSEDDTLSEMKRGEVIAKEKYNVSVRVIDWKENRGKRDGMAESVRESSHEILVFIDSDSFVEKDTLRNLVKYFVDPDVGAVAGQAYVANAEKNFLTKMQEVKYFVAFKAYKSAEAIFGGVSCCSGCCAAYRRSYIIDHMDAFLNQYFLGVRCTYGDDRSLTNIVLKNGHKALFAPDAISHTFAPDNMRQFLKQQLRWKKSWTRETFVSSKFMWKKHPFLAISHFVGFLLPLAAPFVVFRALVIYPLTNQTPPYYYFFGIVIMSFVYGLYYYIYMRDNKWIYGVIFSIFYTFLLVWQLPWAILNIRDPKWGTR